MKSSERAQTGVAKTGAAKTGAAKTGRAPVPPSTWQLLAAARHGLHEAAAATRANERYAAAHLAALRCAAAVLAARARPATQSNRRDRRPRSAWALLTEVAPEFGEWAAFFAAGAAKRAAAEAAIEGVVTTREADDLLRDVETFLALTETAVGLAHQPTLRLDARAS